MTPAGQAIDVLHVEDDPGDELMTREAFEFNKVRNTLHVVRDGEQALDFLYRRGEFTQSVRPELILLDLNLPSTTDDKSSRRSSPILTWPTSQWSS